MSEAIAKQTDTQKKDTTPTYTHTGEAIFDSEQDVHRWQSLKNMSAPIT